MFQTATECKIFDKNHADQPTNEDRATTGAGGDLLSIKGGNMAISATIDPKDFNDNELFSMACACIDQLQLRENYDYIQQTAEYAMAAKLNDLCCDDDTRALPTVEENDYPS